MRSITFTLAGLPKSPNGSHGSWKAAAGIRKSWRRKSAGTAMTLAMAMKIKKPFEAVRITCIRRSSREMDFDNLVASFKPIIDGITDAGIIRDDKNSVVRERIFRWEPAPNARGHIQITVEEILC